MLNPTSNWFKEFSEKGTRLGLIDRFVFHSGLTIQVIQECTGLSLQTVKKHLQRLVKEDLLIEGISFTDDPRSKHFRITDKMRKMYGRTT